MAGYGKIFSVFGGFRRVRVEQYMPTEGKQTSLGGTVCLHGMVKIQMLRRQIGKNAQRKAERVAFFESQRVRRGFHDDGLNAVLRHTAQRAEQLLRIGGGHGAGEGADQTGFASGTSP